MTEPHRCQGAGYCVHCGAEEPPNWPVRPAPVTDQHAEAHAEDGAAPIHDEGCHEWCNHCIDCGQGIAWGSLCADCQVRPAPVADPDEPHAEDGAALTLGAGQGPSLDEIDPPLLDALRPLIARYGALGLKHTVDLLTDRPAPVADPDAEDGA